MAENKPIKKNNKPNSRDENEDRLIDELARSVKKINKPANPLNNIFFLEI